jgi:hypothetical protein
VRTLRISNPVMRCNSPRHTPRAQHNIPRHRVATCLRLSPRLGHQVGEGPGKQVQGAA